MKAFKCKMKGCKAKHKSETGYCAKHVEEGMRQRRVYVPRSERACEEPSLAEELGIGYDYSRWRED